MELRAKVFAPRRFDDPESHGELTRRYESEEPRRRCGAKASRIPYRIVKHVEYNPNIRPAAFPTLESWLPRTDAANGSSSPGGNYAILGENSELRTGSPTEKSPRTSISAPPRRRSQRSRSAVVVENSDDASEVGDRIRSNGLDNLVYNRNMMVIDEMQKRTDNDWDIAEMQTSSEDEKAASASRKKVHTMSTKCPAWDELPIPNQLDLINTLSDRCNGEQNAMMQLHLNPTQKKAMSEILAQQELKLSAEDSQIEDLQAATNRILMADNSTKAKHMSQAQYRKLVKKHLYKSDEDRFNISTRAGLVKAKQYLQFCGYKPELLDHWTKGSYQADHDTGESAHVPPLKPVTQLQETAQLIPAAQSSGPGRSNIQDLVGQQSFQTTTESDAILPLPANTSKALQASNPSHGPLSVVGRIEISENPSFAIQNSKSEYALSGRHQPSSGRIRIPASCAPRPQDIPSSTKYTTSNLSAVVNSIESGSPQAPIQPPTPYLVVSSIGKTSSSHTNSSPSTQAPVSDPTLIAQTRPNPAALDAPPPRKSLRLRISKKKSAARSSAAHENNIERQYTQEKASHNKNVTLNPKRPAMLAELESSPGFKSEEPASSSRKSSKGGRRTTVGFLH